MPSQKNFVLPGIRDDPTNSRLEALIVLAAFAYSRVWNPRRLECHLYGLWNQILSYLLFDLAPNIFLVPQYAIDLSANETFDPNSSFKTVADGEANERIPDFVALLSVATIRKGTSAKEQNIRNPIFPSSFSSWDSIQIISALPVMIVQVKRSPPRSLPLPEDFLKALTILLRQAALEADESATLAFNDPKNDRLHKIVLVAVSGEWWKFKFACRVNYENTLISMESESSSSSEDENEGIQKKTKGQGKGKKKAGLKAVGQSLQRHKDLGHEDMAQLEADVNDAEPGPAKWSQDILFGTPASNQRLYLIHEMLKKIQDEVVKKVEQETGIVSQESSEDELLLKPE